MKAFVTASIDPVHTKRLERHMDLHVEEWKKTKNIFFDGNVFAERISQESCDVLIVEADLVQKEVFAAVDLKMIGVCRGDPVNVDLPMPTPPSLSSRGSGSSSTTLVTISICTRQ